MDSFKEVDHFITLTELYRNKEEIKYNNQYNGHYNITVSGTYETNLDTTQLYYTWYDCNLMQDQNEHTLQDGQYFIKNKVMQFNNNGTYLISCTVDGREFYMANNDSWNPGLVFYKNPNYTGRLASVSFPWS